MRPQRIVGCRHRRRAHRLHQRPRHRHAGKRQDGVSGDLDRVRRARHANAGIVQQVDGRPHPLRRRRGGGRVLAADARASANSADHQLRCSGSGNSLRRRSQQGARRPRHHRDVELIRLRRPERLADSDARTGLASQPFLHMSRSLPRARARLRDAAKRGYQAGVGALTIGMLRTTRYFDPIKTANLFGRIARSIGPMMREPHIGRANLPAAFPEKSPAEIETILAGVWDNLGRVGAEFAHLDHIWEHDPAHPETSRIEIQTRTHELFAQLRLDGKPALIFASHLGNWEMPALAAVAHGLDATILYRRPNIASADRIIQDMRAVKMGTLIPTGRDAPLKLAEALQNGQHVAMLADHDLTNAVEVTFFVPKTRTNPLLARLLRQLETPVH